MVTLDHVEPELLQKPINFDSDDLEVEDPEALQVPPAEGEEGQEAAEELAAEGDSSIQAGDASLLTKIVHVKPMAVAGEAESTGVSMTFDSDGGWCNWLFYVHIPLMSFMLVRYCWPACQVLNT